MSGRFTRSKQSQSAVGDTLAITGLETGGLSHETLASSTGGNRIRTRPWRWHMDLSDGSREAVLLLEQRLQGGGILRLRCSLPDGHRHVRCQRRPVTTRGRVLESPRCERSGGSYRGERLSCLSLAGVLLERTPTTRQTSNVGMTLNVGATRLRICLEAL